MMSFVHKKLPSVVFINFFLICFDEKIFFFEMTRAKAFLNRLHLG